ncbi:MAG: hypothetical protein FWF03_05415 [Defluviitaleaceae bacterium]|nr:hypothetical protein [Defluviitaleaceae bacterium]
MDNRIIDSLITLRDTYGDAVFYNHIRVKYLLNDVAPLMRKETIQVVNFLEMNGYFQLKHAGNAYPIMRVKLVQNFKGTYSVDESTAIWVVNVFSAILGYSEIKTGAMYLRELERASLPVPEVSEMDETQPADGGTQIHEKEFYKLPNAMAGGKNEDHAAPVTESLRRRVSADYHTAVVTADGLAHASGPNEDGQCNTNAWREIIEISAGTGFTVGLKSDGTAVATGRNDFGQCNVRHWTNITQISAGTRHVVGLRSDGTVVASGQNKNGECGVQFWRNITRVAAGCQCSFAIKKDGKALVKGSNKRGEISVANLSGVSEIENAAPGRAVALLSDGRIAKVGKTPIDKPGLYDYRGVSQISAAPDYIAGILQGGRVKLLAYFWSDTGIECSLDDWRDVAAIAAGRYHIVGIKRDGTLVTAMLHPNAAMDKGQCDFSGWRI